MRIPVALVAIGLIARAAHGQPSFSTELSAREKQVVIHEARMIPIKGAAVREFQGWRAHQGNPAQAFLQLGPHTLEPRAFSIDFVSCQKPLRERWRCRLDRTERYVWTPPVVVATDLNHADEQRLIEAGFEAMSLAIDPDGPMRPHYLRKAAPPSKEGEFVFDDGCEGVYLALVNGVVKPGNKFRCID